MSNRKKFLLIFVFVILDMFLLIGFLVIRDKTLENKLKKEVQVLSTLDITTDRYNLSIKSRGNYALIEKTIKEYLDNYAVNLQSVLGVINDEKFKELLSINNYSNDGPEFKKSLKYISTTKKAFIKNIDSLIEDCDEEAISNYINRVMMDPYYINLYKELMLDNKINDKLLDTKRLLINRKKEVLLIFDTCEEVYKFLNANQNDWQIENNEIQFRTNELLNQYNNLISKIK